VAVILFALTSFAAPAHAAGVTPTCIEEQYALRSMGYLAVKVDGTCGAVEARATRHLQAASGLEVDGIMGPITWAALAPAVRVEAPAPQLSNAGGLHGMPFAPDGLDLCQEMSYYRVQAGLPERFDAIGYRESRCQNDAKSTTAIGVCCVGFWANHISSHLSPQSAYRPFIIAFCEVTGRADVYGTDPLQKQKQACVTKVVFDISGYSPWSL
jgi:Putative peptidoglycan binding domain